MPIILRQDESLIKIAHRHVIFLIPIFFTWPLLIVAAFVARYFLNFYFFGYWGLVLAILIFIVTLVIIYKFYIWRNNALIITSQRVIKNEQRGFFSKTVTELLYHDILETSYSKEGVAASVYDYGDLQIRTASENKILIEKIAGPDKVVEMINRIRHGDLPVGPSKNTEPGPQ